MSAHKDSAQILPHDSDDFVNTGEAELRTACDTTQS